MKVTTESKAKELVEKFGDKKAASLAVDEIISANPHSNPLNTDGYSTMTYWIDVRREIEKL